MPEATLQVSRSPRGARHNVTAWEEQGMVFSVNPEQGAREARALQTERQTGWSSKSILWPHPQTGTAPEPRVGPLQPGFSLQPREDGFEELTASSGSRK